MSYNKNKCKTFARRKTVYVTKNTTLFPQNSSYSLENCFLCLSASEESSEVIISLKKTDCYSVD